VQIGGQAVLFSQGEIRLWPFLLSECHVRG